MSKAIYHGVPMVLLPWNRDQPGVADRAAQLGTAEIVRREDVNDVSVGVAVSRVLEDTRYREMASRISARIQATNSTARACRLVEEFGM